MNATVMGAFKSKTVWLGLLVAILSWAQTTLGASGLSPEQLSVAGTVIGGLIIFLRSLTTKPLSEK